MPINETVLASPPFDRVALEITSHTSIFFSCRLRSSASLFFSSLMWRSRFEAEQPRKPDHGSDHAARGCFPAALGADLEARRLCLAAPGFGFGGVDLAFLRVILSLQDSGSV